MKNEFNLAFNEVLEEKQLPKEVIMAAIESAMVSAYRRSVNASTAQHVEAKVDPETGQVKIYAEKEVVEDVQDERTEVLLDVARQVNPEAQLGDMVVVETTPADFGRVAAQTARQVIQQRIREAERQAQLVYFERQVGEIVSGVVQATSVQGITIGLDMKAEGIMPSNQKIPGERFHVHDRMRAVVLEVKDGTRGPQIILSRAHRNFLRRLLENEVPEIYHGIVEIRAIAREPGQRAKVAVSASQAGVDPVGACVGVRGVRIQAIVKELHDEKIDIIAWNLDPVVYISKAISPARVTGVYLSETIDGSRTATVVVSEDQLSLAIGRDGQNARLAAKLTGWRIDIKSLPEACGDSLARLQEDQELQALLPAAVETIPTIQAILAKKAEDRPVTPEEYLVLAQFVERVERRTLQRQEEALRVEQERITTARAEVPVMAFQTPLEPLGLADKLTGILSEGGYTNLGDLMLTLKLSPDKVLALSGIGPKAMETIAKALAGMTFPEPQPEPEPVVEAPIEVAAETTAVEGQPVEGQPIEGQLIEGQPVEGQPIEAAVAAGEAAPEPVAVSGEAVPVAEGEPASLDEVFALRPELLKTEAVPEGEDEEGGGDKKKKKKQKKSVTLEYDESLDQVVSRKKHKHELGWEEEQ